MHLSNHVIEARILTRSHGGETTFIPRITLQPTIAEVPFKFSRRQYPMKLAFGMMIKKSQGQSIKNVGVDLSSLVFYYYPVIICK